MEATIYRREDGSVIHGYGGTIREDGKVQRKCLCGWRTPALVDASLTGPKLVAHIDGAAAKVEARKRKERSARGKKAYAVRKANERAAKREAS